MLLSCFLGSLKTSMASYQSISFPNQAPLKYRLFYLYSAVSPICYDNISIRIYSHSSWCIKLSISFSIWSKLQYEFSLLVKYLYGLKQKPEYGIVSNISKLLHTHTQSSDTEVEVPRNPSAACASFKKTWVQIQHWESVLQKHNWADTLFSDFHNLNTYWGSWHAALCIDSSATEFSVMLTGLDSRKMEPVNDYSVSDLDAPMEPSEIEDV